MCSRGLAPSDKPDVVESPVIVHEDAVRIELAPVAPVEPVQRAEEPTSPSPWDTIAPEIDREEPEVPDSSSELSNLKSQIADDDEPAIIAAAKSGGGAFTIPLICIGIGLIAMCLLVPAADENRRLSYERDRLRADLEQLHRQVATNDAFLRRVGDDRSLAERLARRQLKMIPEGTVVMNLKTAPAQVSDMSPFLLVTVPPPAPMPPYRPVGGFLANACRHPKTQLYLIGGSLLMIASGLVLSRSDKPRETT
jgi:hypothetical protein